MDNIVKKISNVSLTSGMETGLSKQTTNNKNVKEPKNENKPWFDRECQIRRGIYIKIRNRLRKRKSFQDIAALRNESKSYKKFMNRKRHIFNKKMHEKLRKLKSTKPKEYWNLLSPKKRNGNNSINIEALYNHFKTLNEDSTSSDINFDSSQISLEGEGLLNNDFTYTEIDNLINKLKNNKSTGVDNIINEFIKYSPPEFKYLLTKLFNVILRTGLIPTNWCLSFISPIFKNKGSRNDPNNYRGISLISCLGKLFTALINERLTKFVNENNIIGEEQAGFRSGYSTYDHIFTLQAIIDLYLNKVKGKPRLFCAFIDYQKAFDLVDRTALWTKLLSYNINGKIMNVIYNIYQNTKACIKLNNSISPTFNCNIGVRQGDNLSPLLFSLFINDFETFLLDKYNGLKSIDNLFTNTFRNDEIDTFLKLYVLLYADDTIIMAEKHEDLQKALNAAFAYCNLWKLKINIDKTKIIRFSKKKPRYRPQTFWLNNQPVEIVDTYTYLGTVFSYNGKFNNAIDKQILQAQRALFAIKSKKETYNLPVDIMLDLFDKMIMPILLYGCEIWGYANLDKIEIFYRKFLKFVLTLNDQTTNCMVYGESGRTPLGLTIKSRMVCFWHKLSVGNNNKLASKLLCLTKKLYKQDLYISPWLKAIESILNSCGMRNVWLNPEIFKFEWLKKAINLKLSDMYKQEWQSLVSRQNSCITYRSIKLNLELEKYLILLDSSDRINICRFRCRNSYIPVVTRAYIDRDIPYENRTCTICNMNEPGDEFHYIIRCPSLQQYRNSCISNYYMRNPNIAISELFQSTNVKVLKKLAKFIGEINRQLR